MVDSHPVGKTPWRHAARERVSARAATLHGVERTIDQVVALSKFEMLVNSVFILGLIRPKAAVTTTAIRAAIRPYSIAVIPSSSWPNSFTAVRKVFMSGS